VIAVRGGAKYLELFLASDIRVAADDTVFSQGEVARGVFHGGGATVRFPREIGWGNAMRYMLTGDEWGAPEAYRLGLVQEVAPLGKELDRAIDLANKIAAASPLGVRAMLSPRARPSPPMKPRRLRRCRPNLDVFFRARTPRSSSARSRKGAPRSIAAYSGSTSGLTPSIARRYLSGPWKAKCSRGTST
jgi:hypothetical protein